MRKTRLTRPSTFARRSIVRRVAGTFLLVTCAACKQSAPPDPQPNVEPTLSPQPRVAPEPAIASAASTDAKGVVGPTAPEWAVGKWQAAGTTAATALQLPNNQGVQLAWLKDKGKQHSGAVSLSLTLSDSGEATGDISGALGTLPLRGAWSAPNVLHLELRPSSDGPDVFHGTLTITWDAEKKRGQGLLRATSGDGYWLRSADLEVTRPS
jgi:hypothetical protein